MKDFAHLHVHTEFSLLDGHAKIEPLLKKAIELGQKSIAITDHGNNFGALKFYKSAIKLGIKPIIGIESYLTPGTARNDHTNVFWGKPSQKSDDVSSGGKYTHLTMWAKNNEGVKNLFKISSHSALEGYFSAPRADRMLLEKYHKGIIATTSCPSGEVQTRLRLGQFDEALKAAQYYQDVFGKENYYVEIMNHKMVDNDLEIRVIKDLLEISKKIGAPLIATNDSHYVNAEDYSSHDALLCINSKSVLSDSTRFRFSGKEYYIKSGDEMFELFKETPEALTNTVRVAEECEVDFELASQNPEITGKYMPHVKVPGGKSEDEYFKQCVRDGIKGRYKSVTDEVKKRCDYELGVVCDKGYAGYYLVVSDFINWAKNNNIRIGPGRGSGAGSICAYALGITELDPLEHGLLFERFLNPERPSMPDFDIDIDDRGRDRVIEYVSNKYGSENVAQIVTFGTIKAKNAIRDSARILALPYSVGDELSKLMPKPINGKTSNFNDIFNRESSRYSEGKELREKYTNDPDAKSVVDTARGIEDIVRNRSTHAAGVIMSSIPLMDIIPVTADKKNNERVTITQFEYEECEDLGLVKMDFLGLKNLTIINDTLENIKIAKKEVPIMEKLPLNDKETFSLLKRGETEGVFQLEQSHVKKLLRQLKPTEFNDITAINALNRPGPLSMDSHINYALRKNGKQKVSSIHPSLENALKPILEETYGLIVYQEQVIKIAEQLASYTTGQADILRKAMGKKKKDVLESEYSKFKDGMVKNSYPVEAVDELWKYLEGFASYAFNKSHSASYALIGYWTAYLKVHYPTEYMAALLTAARNDPSTQAKYLAEVKRMNIKIERPDINESGKNFTASNGVIKFGLASIQNVGSEIVESISRERSENGPYKSFHDFIKRAPANVCNKRVLESMIRVGVFDSFGHTRRALDAIFDRIIDSYSGDKGNNNSVDLFSGNLEFEKKIEVKIPTDIDEWKSSDILKFEKDLLGMYVSGHPLEPYKKQLESYADSQIVALLPNEDSVTNDTINTPDAEFNVFSPKKNEMVKISGIVNSSKKLTSKAGKPYAVLEIEDTTGYIECIAFANTLEKLEKQDITFPATGDLIAVYGKVESQEKNDGVSTNILVNAIKKLDLKPDAEGYIEPVVVILESATIADDVEKVKKIATDNPGKHPLHVKIESMKTQKTELVKTRYKVDEKFEDIYNSLN